MKAFNYKNLIKNRKFILCFSLCLLLIMSSLVIRYMYFHKNLVKSNNLVQFDNTNNSKEPSIIINTTVAYINGKTSTDFPDDDFYVTSVFCHLPNSTETAGTAEVTYVYDDETMTTGKWVLNIDDVYSGKTICDITFTESNVNYDDQAFSEDSWDIIANNISSGKYRIGDTKCVTLDGLTSTNSNGCQTGDFLVRLVNTSSPDVCFKDGFSESACGFVVEFVDLFNFRPSNLPNYAFDTNTAKNLETKVYQKLPTLLKENIPCTNVGSASYDTYSVGAYKTVSAKIFMFDMHEYLLDPEKKFPHRDAYDYERQLDYYKNLISSDTNALLIKKYNNTNTGYYSRTLHANNEYIYGINSKGAITSHYNDTNFKMALGFRIGYNVGDTKTTCYPA